MWSRRWRVGRRSNCDLRTLLFRLGLPPKAKGRQLARRAVIVDPENQRSVRTLSLRGGPTRLRHRSDQLEVISQTPQQDEATGEVQHPEKVLCVTLVTHNDSSVVLKPRE
jgi:hypothetical protein